MRSATVVTLLLNWNNWRDTMRCLQSLHASRYAGQRLLVVDNGSQDESVARLQPLLPPPHQLLRNPANFGFARGCNVGMRWGLEQGAAYIWLLNNDTCVPAEALEQLVVLAESDARIGAVGAVLCDMDPPGEIQEWGGSWFSMRTGRTSFNRPPPARQRLDYICGGCMLVRAAALRQVGLFDEGYFLYGEDADMGVRLRQAGWTLAVAPVRIPHRRGASTGRLTQDFFASAAAARLLRTYARWPWPATVCGTLRRMVMPALRGQFRRVAATSAGALEGWRAFDERRPYRLPESLMPRQRA